MSGNHLPTEGLSTLGWHGEGPDPASHPGLFEAVRRRRIFAYLIDLLVLVVIGVFVWLVLGFITVISFGLLSPINLGMALVPIAYHSLYVGLRGRTPGMKAMDLEVRTIEGGKPDLLQGLVMTLIFFVTIVPTAWLVLLVSLFNERRRTLHDWLSGVLVVRSSALP